MKITEKKVDALNYKLALEIVKEDYAEKKRKMLAKIRRDAELKGFRKGMAPASLIERLYGERVLSDCINECISENLTNYIKEHNLKLIGEPLPEEGQSVDWNAEPIAITFEYALRPEVKLELSEKDEIPYYNITVTEAAKKNLKETTLKQFGELTDGKKAAEDDFIIVDFVNGETKVEGAYVALRNVSAECKSAFVGIQAGDSLDVNVNEAFANETDRASMLKCTKDELAKMDPVWKMTVTPPVAVSLSAMVSGILSPYSSARMMTNCPGFALAATRGASTVIFTVPGLSSRLSVILNITPHISFGFSIIPFIRNRFKLMRKIQIIFSIVTYSVCKIKK